MIISIIFNFFVSFLFARFDILNPISLCPPPIKCAIPGVSRSQAANIVETPIFVRQSGIPDPDLEVKRAAVLAAGPNVFLWGKDAETPQAIASISKLMTALVFLDHNPGWDSIYKVTPQDGIGGGKNNLFTGDSVKVRDIFYTSLVASDNGATLALMRSTGLKDEDFVRLMNEKAKKIGMFSASFSEPTGLSDANKASARDVARLVREALLQPELKKAVTTKHYEYQTAEGREKKVNTTDNLLFDNWPEVAVLGGKTGFTEAAGYCFAAQFRNKEGKEIISVVMGANDRDARFLETKKLVTWIYNSYAINR